MFKKCAQKLFRPFFSEVILSLLGLFGFLPLLLSGCSEPMKEGRGAPHSNFKTPKRDFGEEIYKFLLKEASYHPTLSKERVAALKKIDEEWKVAQTVDAIVPKAMLSDFEKYLRSLLPFYDDDTLSGLTTGFSQAIWDVTRDDEMLKALILIDRRIGLSPPMQAGEGSLLYRILSYPKQREFLQKMVDWASSHDGYRSDGKTSEPSETPLIKNFVDALGDLLIRTNRKKLFKGSDLLSGLLFLNDERLDMKIGKRCAVRFDVKGEPLLTEAGRKAPKPLPEPFGKAGGKRGPCGEALFNGKPIYQLTDLSKSILATLLADGRKLILHHLPIKGDEIPFPFNMTTGIRPLLEPKDPKTGGFSQKAPINGAVAALFKMGKGPQLHKIVRYFARIFDKNEQEFAAQLAMINEIIDIAKKYDIDINPNSELFDELLPFVQELLVQKGFLRDLLQALQKPDVAEKLKYALIQMMRYGKQQVTLDDYKAFQGGKKSAIFQRKVLFDKPESRENMSYLQGLLYLLADVNRFPYRSRLKTDAGAAIPLIEMRIDNLALFFMRAVVKPISIWETIYVNGKPIDNKFLKESLRKSFPVMGLSENPNPEELSIFLNRKLYFENVPLVSGFTLTVTLEPIKGRFGRELRKAHADSLLASLASGLVSKEGGVLKPIAQVFDKYGKLQTLLDIFVVLNKHWAGKTNQDKTIQGKLIYPRPRTNLRCIEPVMAESLEKTGLMTRMKAISKILAETRLSDKSGAERGIDLLQKYIAFTAGAPKTPPEQSPLNRLLKNLTEMAKALKGAEKKRAREAWEDAISTIYDLFLKVEGRHQTAHFVNSKIAVMATKALYFLADYIERRSKEGQWGPEFGRLERNINDLLADPIMPALLDIAESIVQDKELLKLTTDLLVFTLPDPQKEPKQFAEILSVVAVLIPPIPDDIFVPSIRHLGRFLTKRKALIFQLINFLHRSLPLDKKAVLLHLLRNGAIAHPTKGTILFGLFADLFAQLLREHPNATAKLSVGDLKSIFTQVAKFLVDEKKGLEKLYKVVKNRGVSSPAR